jgi:hypothetical protein
MFTRAPTYTLQQMKRISSLQFKRSTWMHHNNNKKYLPSYLGPYSAFLFTPFLYLFPFMAFIFPALQLDFILYITITSNALVERLFAPLWAFIFNKQVAQISVLFTSWVLYIQTDWTEQMPYAGWLDTSLLASIGKGTWAGCSKEGEWVHLTLALKPLWMAAFPWPAWRHYLICVLLDHNLICVNETT